MIGTKTLGKFELMQFTGTENWHRHALVRKMPFTDSAEYVTDNAGAHSRRRA